MAHLTGGLLDGLSKNFEITEGSGDRTTDSGEAIRNALATVIAQAAQRAVPKMVMAFQTSNVYGDLVNITDKGVLTGISQALAASASQGYLKIIIDGTTVFDNQLTSNTNAQQPISLSFNHPFGTSLQVQHKSLDNTNAVITWVSYTTD